MFSTTECFGRVSGRAFGSVLVMPIFGLRIQHWFLPKVPIQTTVSCFPFAAFSKANDDGQVATTTKTALIRVAVTWKLIGNYSEAMAWAAAMVMVLVTDIGMIIIKGQWLQARVIEEVRWRMLFQWQWRDVVIAMVKALETCRNSIGQINGDGNAMLQVTWGINDGNGNGCCIMATATALATQIA